MIFKIPVAALLAVLTTSALSSKSPAINSVTGLTTDLSTMPTTTPSSLQVKYIQINPPLCCWKTGLLDFGCHKCPKADVAGAAEVPLPETAVNRNKICCIGSDTRTCNSCDRVEKDLGKVTSLVAVTTTDDKVQYMDLSGSGAHALCCWWWANIWPICVECPSATSATALLAARTAEPIEAQTRPSIVVTTKKKASITASFTPPRFPPRDATQTPSMVTGKRRVDQEIISDTPCDQARATTTSTSVTGVFSFAGRSAPLFQDNDEAGTLPITIVTTKKKATKTLSFTPPRFPPRDATQTPTSNTGTSEKAKWEYKLSCTGNFGKYTKKCSGGTIDASICLTPQCSCNTVGNPVCKGSSGCSDKDISEFCRHGSPYWACGCEPPTKPL